jgi:CBS domain-containing protein
MSMRSGSFRVPRLRHVRVADAMHPGVLTCSPETPLREVARMMATHHVHCVVVRGVPGRGRSPAWGLVSDIDLVTAVTRGDLEEPTAGELASTDSLTVSADDPLDRAAQLMAEHRATHLIALTPASGEPAGVLSTLDLAGIVAWGET